jgi:hypothetical protein
MPSLTSSTFERTYNSLSGVDIKAIFHNKAVAELQAISYAVQREKAPIYTMGSVDPRAFSRGKRGIAGTLIFAVFDTHALVNSVFPDARFYADQEEIRPSVSITSDADIVGTESFQTVNPSSTAGVEAADLVAQDQILTKPWYSDQVPPFDVVLTGANELGTVMTMKIAGIEILNEGYGISIDDLMSEMQMTYVARAIIPWTKIRDGGTGIVVS